MNALLRCGLPLLACVCLTQCASHKLPKPPQVATPENRLIARQSVERLAGGRPFTCKAKDGAVLMGRRHAVRGRPRAVIIALHGLQSHSGWWTEMAGHLAAQGVEMWCPDRRGSGLNTGMHFAEGHIANWQVWVDDVEALVSHVKASSPGSKVVLLGHSLGGIITAGYLERMGERRDVPRVDRGIALSPGLAVDIKKVNKPYLLDLGLGLFRGLDRRTHIPTPQDIASDPGMQLTLAEDPLMLRSVSNLYLLNVARMKGSVNRNLKEIDVPFHVLNAADDVLIDNAKVEKLVKSRVDKTLLTFHPAMQHAGHTLTADQPQRVAAEIMRMLP
jgi:acylglycerol lipase